MDILGGKYETGDVINEFVGDLSNNELISIKPDNGPARIVDISIKEGGARIKGETMFKPGFYSVLAGSEERTRYSVDIPVSEMFFKRSGIIKIEEIFKDMRWKLVDGSENLTGIVMEDRFGSELFWIFILFAGIFNAVEMVISRRA